VSIAANLIQQIICQVDDAPSVVFCVSLFFFIFCFLLISVNNSDKLVYDMGIRGALIFRREGSTWTPSDDDLTEAHAGTGPLSPAHASTSVTNEVNIALDGTKASVLPILDSVLAKAIAKVQPRLSSLSAERQLYIAEQVSKAKERLADKLVLEMQANDNNEITPQIIKLCMEEVGKELAALKQA
jgi:hypothetical protein